MEEEKKAEHGFEYYLEELLKKLPDMAGEGEGSLMLRTLMAVRGKKRASFDDVAEVIGGEEKAAQVIEKMLGNGLLEGKVEGGDFWMELTEEGEKIAHGL